MENVDVENLLAVGRPVIFHEISQVKDIPRYKTFVRGWMNKSHIIMDRPMRDDHHYVPFSQGMECQIRFVAESHACVFNSIVLEWDKTGTNAYCRIGWPKNVQTVAFRKHERLEINSFCHYKSITEGTRATGMGSLCDLSMGGCGFWSEKMVPVNTELELSMTLPDGTAIEELRVIVRSSRQEEERFFSGCSFVEGQMHPISAIAFYIAAVLRHQGGLTNFSHILLFEPNNDISNLLCTALQKSGYDAFCAPGLVDGMFRLRSVPPSAVLINQQQKELEGVEICRIIKATRGFTKLPILVYGGGDDKMLEARAARAGANEYITSIDDTDLLLLSLKNCLRR